MNEKTFGRFRAEIAEEQKQFLELTESLKNIELLRPLLPMLNKNFGGRGLALNGSKFGLHGSRSDTSLSALGPDSEVKLLGSARVPEQTALYKEAQDSRTSSASYTPEQKAEVEKFEKKRFEWFDEMEKIIKSAPRKKNSNGHEPFALVFRANGETLGMLWNISLTMRNGESGKPIIDSISGSTKSTWVYARTDKMWEGTKMVRQRNYSAKNNWDKFREVQVATRESTRTDIVNSVLYELGYAEPNKLIEVYGVYPDVESFKTGLDRSKNKPATDDDLKNALKKDLSSAAVDKLYADKISMATENFKKMVDRVSTAIIQGVLDPKTDRKKWIALEDSLDVIKSSMSTLRNVSLAVKGRKEFLVTKSVNPNSYAAKETIYTEEYINELINKLKFLLT